MDEKIASSGLSLNKKTIAGLAGLMVLLVATGIGVYLTQQKQVFKPKAYETKPVSGPETSFTLNGPAPQPLGSDIRIFIMVRSDIEAANLFAAKLRFPKDLLEVKQVITDGRGGPNFSLVFITNWIERVFDNQAGTVSLVGGVPHPGFQTDSRGMAGYMGAVVFGAKKVGQGTISFETDSAIYRNSDNVNILNIKREATVSILAPSVTPTPTPAIPSITGVPLTPTPILNGDINRDGKITLQDMSALLSRWGKTGNETGGADLNGDGLVNTIDYSMMIKILIDNGVIKSPDQLPSSL